MAEMTRDEVFAELERRNAARAVVEFSGGNDEGGADRVTLHDEDDVEIAELQEDLPCYVYDDAHKAHVPYEPTDDEEADARLAETLTAPVYDEYSGFAGDFSVEGRVVWDVASRTVSMNGSETEYVPFEKAV